MNDHYNRKCEPIDRDEWARLMDDRAYRRVAETFTPQHRVSTVWLGLNHAFSGPSPLIFETMVFEQADGKTTNWLELDAQRYTFEDDALAGHNELVAKYGGEVGVVGTK